MEVGIKYNKNGSYTTISSLVTRYRATIILERVERQSGNPNGCNNNPTEQDMALFSVAEHYSW